MSDRQKRIIRIAAFVAVVLAAGFLIWWFFFRPLIVPPSVPTAPPTLPPPPTIGLPPAERAERRPTVAPVPAAPAAPSPVAAGGLTATAGITDVPILSPTRAPDGIALNYYNRRDGKFYRILPDGSTEPLSDQVFFNVSRVTWAPNQTQAILEYPDGSNILYNFGTGRQATLPRHWREFNFSPRSDQIAFLSFGIDADSRWLSIASPDGSNSRAIEPLGQNADKVMVSWSPNDQVIAFSRTGFPQGAGEQEVLLIGKGGENFRSLIVNGIGFNPLWSPDGERLLYSAASATDDWKPGLWIARGLPDEIGEQKVAIGLATWANKCAFSGNDTLYCAVPRELPRGAGLYPAAVGNTPDQLWRVELSSGAKALMAIPDQDHTIDNIVIAQDGRYLYFTDSTTGQLYKINLK